MLTILYGIIGGAGTGTLYAVPITTAAKWFPEKAGTAIGLTVLGFGLSPLVTAPIIAILIELVGPPQDIPVSRNSNPIGSIGVLISAKISKTILQRVSWLWQSK